MADLILQIPFPKIGWGVTQFLWISSIYLSALFICQKVLWRFSVRLKYNIGIVAFLSMPVIPFLLFVEHSGSLPPIGLADWGSPETLSTTAPIIEGLPQITGINLNELVPSLYFWAGVLWLAFASIILTYHLWLLICTQLKCRRAQDYDDQEIQTQLQKLTTKYNINQNIKIKQSNYDEGPGVAGIFQHYILIPESLSEQYTKDEIKALLLHELLHIKRSDYVIHLFQKIICGVFFFQPLAWKMSTDLNYQRELTCDRGVTSLTKDSYTYSNSLIKLQLQAQSGMSQSLSMANNNIVGRIKQLVETNVSKLTFIQRLSRSLLAFLIIAITLFSTFWNSYHLHFSHNKIFPASSQKTHTTFIDHEVNR